MSGTFPIILYPPAVLQAQKASTAPQVFDKLPPRPPSPLPPPYRVRLLSLQAVIFAALSIAAASFNFGILAVTGILLLGISVGGFRVF